MRNKRRVDVLPSTNGKARMFRVGILKFMDSYNFMTMSLDKIANVYQVKGCILMSTLRMRIAIIINWAIYQ